MDFAGTLKKIVNDRDGLFGAMAVLSPPVTNYIKEQGFDTVEKLMQYLLAPAQGQAPKVPAAKGPAPKGPGMFGGLQVTIAETGGANNNYWSYGGMACRQSVPIDKWR